MSIMRPFRCLALAPAACAALAFLMPSPGSAHGTVGKRVFPATIATEDPLVADELALPSFSHQTGPAEGEEPPEVESAFEAEYAKRITRDLALSIGGAWVSVNPEGEEPSISGFENIELGLKYQAFESAAHEFVLSLGFAAEIGGSGTDRLGVEEFSSFEPVVLFGKGFGDLPDSMDLLKPVALTGSIGIRVPERRSTSTLVIDPDTGEESLEVERHFNVLTWNMAIEYSLPYLQQSVRDVGLGAPFNRLVPLVEFAMETPLGHEAGDTTGTINPGVLWVGQAIQIGVEAIIPVNRESGKDVGVRAELHFNLDDLFPTTLGKPLIGD